MGGHGDTWASERDMGRVYKRMNNDATRFFFFYLSIPIITAFFGSIFSRMINLRAIATWPQRAGQRLVTNFNLHEVNSAVTHTTMGVVG